MKPLLLALLSAGLSLAQTARVAGTVLSSSGEPVPRATVTLNQQSATTDDQGRFAIENIPAGRGYSLVAQRPGYVRGAYGARSAGDPGTPLTLAAGQELTGLTITLTPQGVVTGQVTDAAGDPVPGVPVNLLRSAYSGTARTLEPAGSAVTDDRGQYRIAERAPGRYYLSVTDRTVGSRLDPAPEQGRSGLTTFYPSAADPLGAAPVEVFAGSETAGINVRLRAPRTYVIRAKAVDTATGNPVAGADVSLVLNGGSASLMYLTRRTTKAKSDGTFEFAGLEAGTYTLQLVPQPPYELTARTDVTITDRDVEDRVLLIRRGAILTGRMSLDSGDIRSLVPPGSPATVGTPGSEAYRLAVNAHLMALMSSERGQPVTNYRPSVELTNVDPGLGSTGMGLLQEDGTFLVEHISASHYYVAVAVLPPGYFVKSMRFGGIDVLQSPLDLTERGGELDIVLSSKAAELGGVLRNEKGEAQAARQVTLWPKSPLLGVRDGGIRRATTDQNGAFQFRSIPPGDYLLAGWDGGGLLSSPMFLSLFDGDAIEVKLADSDRANIDAKLIPAADIAAAVSKLP